MIVIDSEFESLIPPLTEDELMRLECSILSEGYHTWQPIVTWNGTIIDGHNRYRICEKHGIKFTTQEMRFESRDAAKIWILNHQFGRRNLTSGQKAALAIDLHEAEVREEARLRKKQHGNTAPGRTSNTGAPVSPSVIDTQPTTEDKPKGRTAEILAEKAGVGHMTIKRAMKVKQEDEELYDKVRKGEMPVTTAYEQVAGKKIHEHRQKARFSEDGRRICAICGQPIDEGDAYESDPGRHKKCRDYRNNHGQYKNPDKALIENVAVYSTDSLIAELISSVEMMKDAITQSIVINESMGVSISKREKRQLDKAVSNVFKAIEKIGKD